MNKELISFKSSGVSIETVFESVWTPLMDSPESSQRSCSSDSAISFSDWATNFDIFTNEDRRKA